MIVFILRSSVGISRKQTRICSLLRTSRKRSTRRSVKTSSSVDRRRNILMSRLIRIIRLINILLRRVAESLVSLSPFSFLLSSSVRRLRIISLLARTLIFVISLRSPLSYLLLSTTRRLLLHRVRVTIP